MALPIVVVGDGATVTLAAAELQRCLALGTGVARPEVTLDDATEVAWPGLVVGTSEDLRALGVAVPQPAQVADPTLDDVIGIDVAGDVGVVTGNNPRSVLIAAYRYLRELGCRWVRPGADGEYIPDLRGPSTSLRDPDELRDRVRGPVELRAVRVVEAPSYRHRGVCIEGATSLEHVLNVVEWLPRVGMNSYFVQFREAFTFFDRWYSHIGNPFAGQSGQSGESGQSGLSGQADVDRSAEHGSDGMSGPFDVERARELTAQVAAEVTRRGLLLHAVGHGWTCEPLGMRGLGWEYPPDPVPDEARQYLALMNGARELFGGVPLNTNLCYSNPEARRIVVDDVVRYAAEHPEVDLLHLWLADGMNNHCECDDCRTARPADFYVRLLNEADARLTELGLPTRLVFLIYVDLLWPPMHERLANPDRFVLMFAPITRTYSEPYRLTGASPELADYERNRLAFPTGVDANVAYLRAWQGLFDRPPDSFDYDYHLMWDHVNDPGTMQVSRVLHADVQELRALELDGYVSCQVQRASFPTGLAMTVMAATLWDRSVRFDEVADDHFAAAFGPDGAALRRYLEQLSELFDPVALRGEKPTVDGEAADRLARVPQAVAELRPVLARNAGSEDPCWNASWRYLALHAELVVALADALESRARGDLEAAESKWQAFSERLWRLEPELHTVLDPWVLTSVYAHRFQPYGIVA